MALSPVFILAVLSTRTGWAKAKTRQVMAKIRANKIKSSFKRDLHLLRSYNY